MKCVSVIIQILFLSSICLGTLSPPVDKKSQKGVKPQEGSRKNNVLDRKLVVETPYVKDILKYHATYHQDTSLRNFKNTVFGYVTPVRIDCFILYYLHQIFYCLYLFCMNLLDCHFQWNSKGYDVAKTWAPKFDYISPVWLQVKRQSPNIYIISGLHDVDNGWMKSVKQKGIENNIKSMF